MAVALTLLLAVSCDKMPLLAPSGTTITMSTSTNIVQANGSVQVSAMLLESAGTPVQNGTTVTFSTTLGRLAPSEARTMNGVATVQFQPAGTSGVAEIRATSGGAKPADTANPGVKITVGAAAAGRITVTASPSSVAASGGASTITAVVVDTAGNPLRDIAVTFSTNAGTLSTAVASTDAGGNATATLNTTREAIVTVSVGGGATSATNTATVTVRVAIKPTVGITVVGVPSAGVAMTFNVTANPGAPPSAGASGGAPLKNVRVVYGDGGADDLGAISGTTPVQHLYSRSGTFTVSATAEDTAGETAVASTVVVVPFTISLGVSTSPGTLTGIFTANVNPANTTIVRFVWAFHDGLSVDTGSSNTTSRIYGAPGNYQVSVNATSSTGQTATTSITATIPP
ncbi:MAG: PKD domain-containing protein [Vicinamibacterales bacterium]|nr:PKD domain-containing protein [Vicinamibacterales bacterium]